MDSLVPKIRARQPLSDVVDEPLVDYNRFNEMFVLNTSPIKEPYDVIIFMRDESRWKLDPKKIDKLCDFIHLDQINRIECIFKQSCE